MKITKLKIRNLFGVREFDSDGKDIELTGKNGAGKSGVIDAIRYALTNKSSREYIITKGEKEGEVLIETDTGLRVNRKARTEKADYKSIRQGEEKDEKTESFLREIFTELQLNPIEFAQMDEKAQNRIILDLVEFKWDMNWIREQFGEIPPKVNYEQNILCVLRDIQAEEGFYFTTRQDINRDIRNKQAFIEEIAKSLPENYNAAQWEAKNLGDTYKKIESIRTNNDRVREAKAIIEGQAVRESAAKDRLESEKARLNKAEADDLGRIQRQIEDLKRQIESLEAKKPEIQKNYTTLHEKAREQYEAVVAEIRKEASQHEATAKGTIEDFTDLQSEADTIERMKAHLNEYNRMTGLQKEVGTLVEKTQELTAKIEKARSLPGEILQNANIPIPGLEIVDGQPLINGLPVSNLSDGEKMDLCIRVAAKREGALKMVLLDGIESVATERRKEIYKALKENGVQFVAARTTDDDSLTVVELS